MLSKALFVVVTAITIANVLSINENCDPEVSGSCQKGDLIAKTVADCCYHGEVTCTATDRTIGPAKGDKCQPCSGNYTFACGQSGTDTRCVCDDKGGIEILDNRCRCQYWPAAAPSNTTTPATPATTPGTTPAANTTTPATPATTPAANTTTDKTPTTPSKSTTGSPRSDTKHIVTIAVPSAVGGVILIAVVVVLAMCCYVRYSKREGYRSINDD